MVRICRKITGHKKAPNNAVYGSRDGPRDDHAVQARKRKAAIVLALLSGS